MPQAVILTSFPVEYKAVCFHLSNCQERIHEQGTIYEQGMFTANGQTWDVCIAEIGSGNVNAAIEAGRAINCFKPDILCFVGIAQGIHNVKVGDVVAATKVYGYEYGKKGETFSSRPDVGQSAYAVIQRARSEARKEVWTQRLSGSKVPQPDVFVAPIAAGEKVIASRESELFQFIRDTYNDAIAIEMEGLGVLSAAFAYPNMQVIVIRGISDLIEDTNAEDPEEGTQKKQQEQASRNASAFTFELLSKFTIPILSPHPENGHIDNELISIVDQSEKKLKTSTSKQKPLFIEKETNIASPQTEYPSQVCLYKVREGLPKTVTSRIHKLKDNVQLETVLIPEGRFKMGSPEFEKRRSKREGPQHWVDVHEFWMGKYPVTQAQWRVIASQSKVKFDLESEPSYFKGDDLPVERINLYEAEEFCDRLTESMGKNYRFRLPSEAEWEYACRAKTTTPFYFGEVMSPRLGNFDVDNCLQDLPRRKTSSVDFFEIANDFGLYDMHGNVWEWCSDYYHESYYLAQSDGRSWRETGKENERVIRGGSWNEPAWYCRAAYRRKCHARRRMSSIGFRIVAERN